MLVIVVGVRAGERRGGGGCGVGWAPQQEEEREQSEVHAESVS